MSANNVETAFRVPTGVKDDFIRNLLWQYLKQKQQQENINQFTSPATTARPEWSSGNAIDD